MSRHPITQGACAACSSLALELVLDLGPIPLAGAFPAALEDEGHEGIPLTIVVCRACFLVQVSQKVEPSLLFNNYRYLATVPLKTHFESYALEVTARLGLLKADLIVEIGCNDGVLLVPMRDLGFTNLVGVDPAANITEGIPKDIVVRTGFFGMEMGSDIASQYGPARAIFANNVLAHIPYIHDVMAAVAALLAADGVLVFEVHYLVDLLKTFQFDTFYHEHRYYYSLTSLAPLLEDHGLRIQSVDRISNHGGSLRVYASKSPVQISPTVGEMLALEARLGLDQPITYELFRVGVQARMNELSVLVESIPSGQRLVGYGAAGRAVTLLNAVPIVGKRVEYVVDDSPERVGRLIPCVRIPISRPDRMLTDPPTHVLVTAWTYLDRIRAQIAARLEPHGIRPRILTPLPVPEYV